MKNTRTLVLTLTLLFRFVEGFTQSNATLSGYIRIQDSGEPLVSANLWLAQQNNGSTTNADGYFTLSIPKNREDTLRISYVGYQTLAFVIKISRDTFMDIEMVASVSLEEVVISAAAKRAAKDQFGVSTLSGAQIEMIPMILGEADAFKALQRMPGVQGGAEGNAGLYVRGGSPDQNLVLLDGSVVYNTSHLFGYLSVFNPDIVKNIKLTRGGFPASFGGRLSSIVEVTTKEGNREKHQSELSIGLISSRYSAEGPIKKNKTTYSVGTRFSYLGLLLWPSYVQFKNGKKDRYSNYWMYDANLKITHELSPSQKISISLFNGNDVWKNRQNYGPDESQYSLDWGNSTAAVRYTKVFKKGLAFENVASFNYYNYEFQNSFMSEDEKSTFLNSSTIRDYANKSNLTFHLGKALSWQAGLELTNQKVIPNFFQVDQTNSAGVVDTFPQIISRLNNLALYLTQQFRPFKGLLLETGLRMSQYNVSDRNQYHYLEPRLKLSFSWRDEREAIQLNWTRMSQGLHLLSSFGVGLPNDVWVPPDFGFGPQTANQYGGGYRWRSEDGAYEAGMELYEKTMNNLIDFKPNLSFEETSGRPWYNLVLGNGRGRVRGLEFSLQKNGGLWNGWLSYTLSRSERQTPGVSNNQWYPFRYDRRHVLSIFYSKRWERNWSFSANFEFQTGSAVTLPVGIMLGESMSGYFQNVIYGGRNNARMPVYHRADLGFSHVKRKSQHEKTWTLGVYNAYARGNPFFIDYQVYSDRDGNIDSRNTYLFLFRFVPFITWSIKYL
jgi:outer membrane cobalamin receptor